MFDFRRILIGAFVFLVAPTYLTAQIEQRQASELRELNNKVVKLFGEAKFDEALPLAKRALQLGEAAVGPKHLDLIPLLMNVGEIYRAKKKPSQARPYFERALAITEELVSANDLRIAQIAERLGLVAYDQGQKDDAEQFFSKSLAIKEKSLGTESAALAPTLFNLAQIYLRRRDYATVEPILARLVRILEKQPGTDHSDLLQAVEVYTLTLIAQNKTAEIEALQKRINDLLVGQGIVLGGVLNSKAVRLAQPEYPLAARADHASGQVRVQIMIDETGKVISAKTINPEPVHFALAAAAESAARQSVFTPSFRSGTAVRVSGIIVYNFIVQ